MREVGFRTTRVEHLEGPGSMVVGKKQARAAKHRFEGAVHRTPVSGWHT
jgi:hypothetical protein